MIRLEVHKMTNNDNKDKNVNPFSMVKVFRGGKRTNPNIISGSDSISSSLVNDGETAFPLGKLIYGGISSQFLGIISPNLKAGNDNNKGSFFPF